MARSDTATALYTMPLQNTDLLGYRVLNTSAAQVASHVCDSLNPGAPQTFAFLNPHSIVLADRDPALKEAILKCSGVFCDGVGLSLACTILKRERLERVYGYEFFMALSGELSRRKTGNVFFLGGTEESITVLRRRYAVDFPGIQGVESYVPPFKSKFSDEEMAAMSERIAAANADVLWIGLGSPKQEKMLHALVEHSGVRFAAAIGAVFDFYTDRIPHAPAWVRRTGLQWAHRLVLEPRRLWKRTLISAPLFVSRVARELLS